MTDDGDNANRPDDGLHAHGRGNASIARAADIIRRGGVVAMPTETVYGLAANAFDAVAVARIFEIKGRPHFDPLIVHVADLAQAAEVAAEIPDLARKLADAFWPGPLTIVLPRSERIPDIVTSGLDTVAIRLPAHPLALRLIRAAGLPLAAPSANPFGRISPTTAAHVQAQLGNKVDLIVDGGPCQVGVESTIVSLVGPRPALLRPGGLPIEEIQRLTGPLLLSSTIAATDQPQAPGQLARHYSPRTPLVLRPMAEGGEIRPTSPAEGKERLAVPGDEQGHQRIGLLSLHTPCDAENFAAVEVLSPSGDMRQAAAGLFAAMHRLDALGLDLIIAELVPESGLGLAINDRLRRAAARSRTGGNNTGGGLSDGRTTE